MGGYLEFCNDFRGLCNFLKQYSTNIIVESIFYSVVPDRRIWLIRKSEKYDEVVNTKKRRKTLIMFTIAKELGLKTLDINAYMLREGKKFLHVDHIHYEEKAKDFICKRMMRLL